MSALHGNRSRRHLRLPGLVLSLGLSLTFVLLTLVAFTLAGGSERSSETGLLSEKFGFAPEDCPSGQVVPLYGDGPDSDQIPYSDSIGVEEVDESDSSTFLLCGTQTSRVIETYLGGGALAGFGLFALLFVVRAWQCVVRSAEGRRSRMLALSGLFFMSTVVLLYCGISMFTLDLGIIMGSSSSDVFDDASIVYLLSGLGAIGASAILLIGASVSTLVKSARQW